MVPYYVIDILDFKTSDDIIADVVKVAVVNSDDSQFKDDIS